MVSVLAVVPNLLSGAGMPRDALFTATALATVAATALMALVANLPFAAAPGMGIIGLFLVAVTDMGFTWQQALAAAFLSGALFFALSFTPLREKIIREVPGPLKSSVTAGIGVLIVHIGFRQSGIVEADPASGTYSWAS
jgi:AGZA family xanthine/uracil permease-like MFS transporter